MAKSSESGQEHAKSLVTENLEAAWLHEDYMENPKLLHSLLEVLSENEFLSCSRVTIYVEENLRKLLQDCGYEIIDQVPLLEKKL